MSRTWLIVNAVLTCVLLISIARQFDAPVFAGVRPAPGAEAVFVPAAPQQVLLRFSTPMVTDGEVDGEPADLGMRLEPAVPVLGTWIDLCTLRLRAARALAPATGYTIHLDRPLRDAAGRTVPAGVLSGFDTGALRVEEVVADGRAPADRTVILIGFDTPPSLASVREHLKVTARGVPVASEVTERPGEPRVVQVELPGFRGDAASVHLTSGVMPRQGDLGLRADFRERVVFHEPLVLLQAKVGTGGIELRFNQTVPLPDRALIRVEPAVPFQVQRSYRGLQLVGGFPAGSVLKVTCEAGFPGQGRAVLVRPAHRSLLIPDSEPRLALKQTGTVLSARARPELEVEGCNVRSFGIALRQLYPNNVVRFLQARWADQERTFAPARRHRVEVGAARNANWTERVDLTEVLGERPGGIYHVRLWDRDSSAGYSRVIQVTDLGVTFRTSGDGVAVQVVSLATGAPVAGAELQVVTPTNQGLVFGRTGDDGTALLRFARLAEDHVPFLLQVRRDGDRAFVDLQQHGVELTDETLGGRAYLVQGHEAYVAPSRGIIRPGETLPVSVVVRDRRGAAPAGLPLVVRFLAPGGRCWMRRRVELDGSGLADVALATAESAPTGRWTVEVRGEGAGAPVLGSAGFSVAAFTPDRLEAELEVTGALRFGATGTVRVRGRWLDGAPAAGRPVILRARLDPSGFGHADWRAYSFGRTAADDVAPGALPVLRATLDERGEATFRVAVPELPFQAMVAGLAAEVSDPSGRAVHVAGSAPVRRADFHLGVRAGADGADVAAVDAAGALVQTGLQGEVALEWRHYAWDRVPYRHGWRWRTTEQKSQVEVVPLALGGGRQQVRFAALDASRRGGWWAVVVRAAGRTCEQVVGSRPARPDRLRVRAPRVPVAPGATVALQVEAPAAGRGLVTLEGAGIHAVQVVELCQGHNAIGVSLPAGLDLPNVHAVVTLTRPLAGRGGRDDDPGPFWLVGGTSIALEHADRTTTVALEGPREVRPESQLDFAVHAPGAVAATVALVDEGVLNLTRHPDPDPTAFFMARRRLDTRGADIGGFLLSRVRFLPGVKTGGDGGEGLRSRMMEGSVNTRIRPVALFRRVTLDGAGRARVQFRLPPYEGRLRAMVVAAGPSVAGGAAAAVVVKAPLGLQVAMPRILGPGDRSTVPVTIKNHTGAAGEVELTITASAALGLADGEPARRVVPLAAGAIHTVDLPVEATAAGPAGRLLLRARLGEHEREVTGEVAVRTPRVFAREVVGLALEGRQEVALPQGFAAGAAVRLRLDTAPDAHLRGALESLLVYPHGCLEQTTSRCMGLLACRALLPRMLGDAAPQVQPLLEAGVDRIFAMQTRDGGFAWWPGQEQTYPFGTVHALDFLLEAQAAGVSLPEPLLGRALDRLARIVRDDAAALSLRCHAVEVLSRGGRPVQPWLDFLADAAELDEDRARVALALAGLGRARRAVELLQHRETGPRAPGPEDGQLLRTPMRRAALQLRALHAAATGDPAIPSLVARLGRILQAPGRYTTQDKAQALRALAAHYQALPSASGGFVVDVGQGEETRRLDTSGTVTLSVDPARPLSFATTGRVYGWLEVSGPRAQDDERRCDDLVLRSAIFDADDGKPATTFRRGKVYEVRVDLESARGVENFVVTQVLPGGFELEQPAPGRTWRDAEEHPGMQAGAGRTLDLPCHVERRDDRVAFFVPGFVRSAAALRYRVRAVFPGRYGMPPLRAEAMYDPEIQCVVSLGTGVEIVE